MKVLPTSVLVNHAHDAINPKLCMTIACLVTSVINTVRKLDNNSLFRVEQKDSLRMEDNPMYVKINS